MIVDNLDHSKTYVNKLNKKMFEYLQEAIN